jgi:ABC-2 type transport system permease protein
MLFFGIAYGSVADSINEFVKDNKNLSDIVAAQGGGSIVDSYLAMSFRILALLGAGFAVQATLRLRSEETSLRAEQLLSTALSRVRWACGHYAVALTGSIVVLLVSGLAMGLTDAAVTGDTGVVAQALGGMLAYTPAVWLLASLTLALIGLVPRAAPVAWALLTGCFVIGMFGQLLDLPQWASDLSPFQHVPQLPAANFTALPLAILTACVLALTALGLAGLRHRDLQ